VENRKYFFGKEVCFARKEILRLRPKINYDNGPIEAKIAIEYSQRPLH